jgi:hypothetical protein
MRDIAGQHEDILVTSGESQPLHGLAMFVRTGTTQNGSDYSIAELRVVLASRNVVGKSQKSAGLVLGSCFQED